MPCETAKGFLNVCSIKLLLQNVRRYCRVVSCRVVSCRVTLTLVYITSETEINVLRGGKAAVSPSLAFSLCKIVILLSITQGKQQ